MIKVTKEQNQKAGVRKTGNRMIPYGWLPLKTKKAAIRKHSNLLDSEQPRKPCVHVYV